MRACVREPLQPPALMCEKAPRRMIMICMWLCSMLPFTGPTASAVTSWPTRLPSNTNLGRQATKQHSMCSCHHRQVRLAPSRGARITALLWLHAQRHAATASHGRNSAREHTCSACKMVMADVPWAKTGPIQTHWAWPSALAATMRCRPWAKECRRSPCVRIELQGMHAWGRPGLHGALEASLSVARASPDAC